MPKAAYNSDYSEKHRNALSAVRFDLGTSSAAEKRATTRLLRPAILQKNVRLDTNVEAKIRFGMKVDIYQRLVERNLFGHVCRISNKRSMKTVLFGVTQGSSKPGRFRRKWLDDIQEWCNMDIYSAIQSSAR